MPATPLNALNELYALVPIVEVRTADPEPQKGKPTPQFQRQWQDLLAHIADIEARLTVGGL